MFIKHRARVDQRFVDEVISLAQERAADLAKTLAIRKENSYYQDDIFRGMERSTISWVRELARGKQSETALDQELARLYTSKYECFGVQEYNGITYLWGKTLNIVMIVIGRAGGYDYPEKTKVDIGSYFINVPQGAFLNQTYSGVHMIPVRKLSTRQRHPHHTAREVSDNDHPLGMSCSTCAGSFDKIFAVNLANMEVAGLFRSCYMFLTRYNTASPLTSPDEDFMKVISREKRGRR